MFIVRSLFFFGLASVRGLKRSIPVPGNWPQVDIVGVMRGRVVGFAARSERFKQIAAAEACVSVMPQNEIMDRDGMASVVFAQEPV